MKRNFDLLGKYKYWSTISVLLVLASFLAIFFMGLNKTDQPFGLFKIPKIFKQGFNWGIDFRGGTQFTLELEKNVTNDKIRSLLTEVDPDLSSSEIKEVSGDENRVVKSISIGLRTGGQGGENTETIDKVSQKLKEELPVREGGFSGETIGGQISREMRTKGWQAVLLALLVVLIYISWRFRLRFAVGAVAALIHDVGIALGLFAILQVEVNLPTIAAFLTIVGYSLNDTIVYFDRIRENKGKRRHKKTEFFDLINLSINQSLPRTLGTSVTSFMPIFILFIFGPRVLYPFSLALMVGVIFGTYSSIYVASPLVYLWDKFLASE